MNPHVTRHRDAMRRHRRTRALLAAAATVLGLLALVSLAYGHLILFGVSCFVSVLLTEAAARAGRDYRAAEVRTQRAERPPTRLVVRQPVACCGTWVSSAGLVHGPRCDVRRWAA
ncbi:hypothetical protein EES45_23070 [Streptomyces sp. ADI97-07]|uniref:hypothetical protein n=1 Tax=Streptomyces sp. ADI97-07 TaxID=1522762 RepID=UPI000F54D89F|nr:hypothetical protein [Streptomyces sp. ADI97-07]RPK76376.1 hypothetical protein EES45_23070 [Streptomyces sp. ADI97-07]